LSRRAPVRAALAGVAGFAVLAGVVAGGFVLARGVTGGPRATPAGQAVTSRGKAAGRAAGGAAAAATLTGPDGVEARWVIAENRRPGSAAWKIRGRAHGIAGFASRVYARPGQKLTLYVSTAAPWFRAQAFRMGYYQGLGARLVWQSGRAQGRRQPRCAFQPGVNMVSCANWSPSLTVTLGRSWPQGDYLIKLTGSGGQQSYVPLTVWDPASTATYLIKNDVLTWQAWNPYGGYDLYTGRGSCPAGSYPPCSRSRMVSFDRPYAAENGSGNFLTLEYPLVRFAERHGLDVGYATDITLQAHPSVLRRHKVLLSLGDDECWSLAQRRAVVAARDRGMNIVFFGASPMLRHVRLARSPLGPDRVVVDYRDSAADPLDGHGNPLDVTGNTWGSPPADWPAAPFVGDDYAGFLSPGRSTALRITEPSAWVFKGLPTVYAGRVAGVVASNVDHFDAAVGHPAGVQILARSPIPPGYGLTSLGLPFYSDMTYYTDSRGGAGVLDVGTGNWIPALATDPAARPALERITGNILAAFGAGPAGRRYPSVPNWQHLAG
jgi:hypothetical protein